MPRNGWFPVYARAIRNHAKFAGLTHAEIGAWTVLRAEAEMLGDEPFVNDGAAVHVLLRRSTAKEAARQLAKLIAVGLLDVAEDGHVSIHDLKEHSGRYPSDEPDATRDRQEKSRDRRNGHEPVTTSHDSIPLTGTRAGAPVSHSHSEVGSSLVEGGAGGNDGAPAMTRVIDYLEERTGRAWHFRPGSKLWDDLDGDVRSVPFDELMAAYRALPNRRADFATLIYGAHNELFPLNGSTVLPKADPAEQKRANARAILAAAADEVH